MQWNTVCSQHLLCCRGENNCCSLWQGQRSAGKPMPVNSFRCSPVANKRQTLSSRPGTELLTLRTAGVWTLYFCASYTSWWEQTQSLGYHLKNKTQGRWDPWWDSCLWCRHVNQKTGAKSSRATVKQIHSNCRIDQTINRADLRDIYHLRKRLILVHPETRTEQLNTIKAQFFPAALCAMRPNSLAEELKKRVWDVKRQAKLASEWASTDSYFHILDSIQFFHL